MPRVTPSLAFLTALLAPTPSRAANNPLEPLAWLVGGTWVAELPAKGDPLSVHLTVQWSAHKQYLKYAIVFKTKDADVPQYEGVYFWHPAAKEIRLLQIDRAGQVTESVLTVADGKFTQKNTLTRKDGTKQEQRTELTRDGDDAFRFRALVPKGDDWVEGLNLTYKRATEAPPKK
ncbi:MAG TPA: hypothetical protein VKE40_08235 [Gemmataceae bacterium]|nr:hypothetical protein [Gemmataceae bacterium]